MPHFLVQASYTSQATSALIGSPEGRSAAISTLVEGIGGQVEAYYYAFGEYDIVAIAELPDNVTMAALSMAASAGGAISQLKTTVLIPISEGVEAAHKAAGSGYRPPGSLADMEV